MKNAKVFSIELKVSGYDEPTYVSIPVKASVGADGEIVIKLLNGATLGYGYGREPFDDVWIGWQPTPEQAQRIRLDRRRLRARRRQQRPH